MILVTVGMQLGFDRLIRAMDEIAPTLDMPVIAQTGRGQYCPVNMETHESLDAGEFEALVAESKLIVSHAGVGTVLTAQRLRKSVILVPRRADMGEHRNDHQLATAKQLSGRPGILVVWHAAELGAAIRESLANPDLPDGEPKASAELLNTVSSFIERGQV